MTDVSKLYNGDGELNIVDATARAEIEELKTSGSSKYRTFSVLSDSYSSYTGFDDAGDITNPWYPTNDVTDVTQMWWYRFAKSYGAVLIANNSYSGSRIANDPYWQDDNKNIASFVARMKNIGKPELIFILGGTNDSWNGVENGEYVYSDWTADQLKQFRPAFAYMLNYLIKKNVGAKIIFLLNFALTEANGKRTSAIEICNHYGVDYISFPNGNGRIDGNHPTDYGMRSIRDSIMTYFEIPPKVIDEINITGTFPISANKTLTMSEAFVQTQKYKVVVDAEMTEGSYVYLRINVNTTFATLPTGQSGEAEAIFDATQYDVDSTTLRVFISGSGTINSIKLYKVSYD